MLSHYVATHMRHGPVAWHHAGVVHGPVAGAGLQQDKVTGVLRCQSVTGHLGGGEDDVLGAGGGEDDPPGPQRRHHLGHARHVRVRGECGGPRLEQGEHLVPHRPGTLQRGQRLREVPLADEDQEGPPAVLGAGLQQGQGEQGGLAVLTHALV